jgi:hypothetical protein
VANVSARIVAALTAVMEGMAGVANVADRIIGSLLRLRGDRDRGGGYDNGCEYRLGGAESHGFCS